MKNIYANEVYEAMLNENKYRLSIYQDDYAEDPRDWDNLSTMWIWWHQYHLGDKKPSEDVNDCIDYLLKKYLQKTTEDFDNTSDIFKALKSIDDIVLRTIYVYEHSGITISYCDFGDHRDSGSAGFAFVEKDEIMHELCLKDDVDWKVFANKHLDAEMKIYQQYLEGDVFGFILEKFVHKQELCPHCGEVIKEYNEWEEQDSCYGFYGNDIFESGLSDYLPDGFIESATLIKE